MSNSNEKKNFSLTKKAAVMALMLAAAVCIVAVSGIRAADELYNSMQEIITLKEGLSDSVQRIHSKFFQLRLHEKDFLLNIGDSKSQQYYMTEFSLILTDLLTDITFFSTVMENIEQLKNDPRAMIAYEDLEKSIQSYKKAALPIFDMIRASETISPQSADRELRSVKLTTQKIADSALMLQRIADERMKKAVTHMNETRTRSFIIIGIGITLDFLLMIAVYLFIRRAMVMPIRYLNSMLKDISQGTGDLTKRMTSSSNDEIGLLTLYFNNTMDKIQTLVADIKQTAFDAEQKGTDLLQHITETVAAAVHIDSQISVINKETDTQAQSVNQAASSMNTIVTGIDSISNLASHQFTEVSSSTAAVEQMVANINTVTQDVIQSTENVEQLAQCADSGMNSLDTVSELIKNVSQKSEGLLEICAVIESIADQTNLLSMNAAIEAAHAGTYGRGFAVVADEIRKLSESTAEQSKTISSVLTSIKTSIDDILTGAGNINSSFIEMNTKIRTVQDSQTHFRSAMEEQIIASRHIMQSTAALNDISGKVKNGTDSMRTESVHVISQTERLGTLSIEIKDRVYNITADIQQITESVQEINGLGIQNTNSLHQLSEKLASFKTDNRD